MNKFLVPMNSYMKLSCCVQDILFPFSHPLPMYIIILLTPLLQLSLGLGRSGCDIDVPVKAEHSMVSYCLCFDKLGDFVNYYLLEKETSLMRMGDVLIYGQNS